MSNKPVKPVLHGIIDYLFSGIQLIVRKSIGLNNKACKTYQALGAGFIGMNALTDTPVGLKRTISFKDHQKADAAFLATLALLTFANNIQKDKKTLSFHLSFLTIAISHYILTDYNAVPQK